MTEFKKLLASAPFNHPLFDSHVDVTYEGTTLSLRFDKRDVITAAAYEGAPDVWMSSLCELLINMSLSEARFVDLSHWELIWKQDQFFWDMKLEIEDRVFFRPLELLHAALDVFRGREFLYKEESPLICRCFGVREGSVDSYLCTAQDISFENLSKETKAGMGCRTCVPQLKTQMLESFESRPLRKSESPLICRCFGVKEEEIIAYRNSTKDPSIEGLSMETKAGTGCRSCVPVLKKMLFAKPETKSRVYKSRPVADWVEAIDNALNRFPDSSSWKMNVESMKGSIVMISFDFQCTQREEEDMGRKLQGFLAGATDSDLAFFLSRSLQR
jgi:bacterioferritin-associated ferredoxin